MDYCFSILCYILWTIVLCILCYVLWIVVLLFCAMFYGLLHKYVVLCFMDYCFSISCYVLWTIVLVFCVMFYGLLF